MTGEKIILLLRFYKHPLLFTSYHVLFFSRISLSFSFSPSLFIFFSFFLSLLAIFFSSCSYLLCRSIFFKQGGAWSSSLGRISAKTFYVYAFPHNFRRLLHYHLCQPGVNPLMENMTIQFLLMCESWQTWANQLESLNLILTCRICSHMSLKSSNESQALNWP